MTKLQTPTTAGWNAGKNFYATPVRLDEIVIDPKISRLFKVDGKMCAEIVENIKKNGYDKSQPIVLWKGHNTLIDGHTRLSAAKVAGLDEIPAIEMEFTDFEDAILYTFERQVIRRNLTPAEILIAAGTLQERKGRDGKGRAAEQLADRLGVSPATIYQAKKILAEAPEEIVQAVSNGEIPMKTAYIAITKPKPAFAEAVEGIPRPLGVRLAIENREDALNLLADLIHTASAKKPRKDEYLLQALKNLHAWIGDSKSEMLYR
jgi:ParB family chromosome partitioning protein